MIIGFDAKRLFQNFTGLGNYSRFVVRALCENYPQHKYLLFTPRVKSNPDTQPFLSQEYEVIQPAGMMRVLHPLWRTAGLSFTQAAHRLDVFHGLSHELPWFLPARTKKVVTVHDLIFYRYPQYYRLADVLIYKQKLKSACNRAHRIIAISRQTAADLTSYLGIAPDKISVIYQGFHPQFSIQQSAAQIEQVKMRYQLPEKYLLCVGTVEPRKNALVLVEALARLSPSVRLPLVLVGRQTGYAKVVAARAAALGISNLVHFCSNAAFAHLPAIYQGAALFLYPSVFEGFGIPIIEGIASGIPVITSTGSCFAEAGGPDTLYVPPHDAEAWAEAINRVLCDEALRHRMVTHSQQYIEQFQPTVIAKHVMQVYTELLEAKDK
jgi:glycosyltransferase involved in cell wall biosynthesis